MKATKFLYRIIVGDAERIESFLNKCVEDGGYPNIIHFILLPYNSWIGSIPRYSAVIRLEVEVECSSQS